MAARIVFALVLAAASGCVVTRTSRPQIEGTVYDAATDRPLPGVNVVTFDPDTQAYRTEAVTDTEGRFEVPRLTYRELTWPGTEAPPLVYRLDLRKDGYEDDTLEEFDPQGGGSAEASRRYDRVRMQPLPADGG
jgi:hypothetical protein